MDDPKMDLKSSLFYFQANGWNLQKSEFQCQRILSTRGACPSSSWPWSSVRSNTNARNTFIHSEHQEMTDKHLSRYLNTKYIFWIFGHFSIVFNLLGLFINQESIFLMKILKLINICYVIVAKTNFFKRSLKSLWRAIDPFIVQIHCYNCWMPKDTVKYISRKKIKHLYYYVGCHLFPISFI